MSFGNARHKGHINPGPGSASVYFGGSRFSATYLAGHPAYTRAASATSPEVRSVCSQSMLLSSMEAPESSREPERRAHLTQINNG
jgi:hypothetical protein